MKRYISLPLMLLISTSGLYAMKKNQVVAQPDLSISMYITKEIDKTAQEINEANQKAELAKQKIELDRTKTNEELAIKLAKLTESRELKKREKEAKRLEETKKLAAELLEKERAVDALQTNVDTLKTQYEKATEEKKQELVALSASLKTIKEKLDSLELQEQALTAPKPAKPIAPPKPVAKQRTIISPSTSKAESIASLTPATLDIATILPIEAIETSELVTPAATTPESSQPKEEAKKGWLSWLWS